MFTKIHAPRPPAPGFPDPDVAVSPHAAAPAGARHSGAGLPPGLSDVPNSGARPSPGAATAKPASRIAMPTPATPQSRNPGKRSRGPVLSARHPGSIKAKTPAIKANQASSRHTPNIRRAPVPGRGNGQTCQPHRHAQPRHPPSRNPGNETRDPVLSPPRPGSIKAKTPAIKANQASSSQSLKI